MKSRIEQDATNEIVRELKPLILDRLQDDITRRTHLSIYTVAGMLDVSPATAKRIFEGRIITIGRRQQRVSVRDYDEVMASYSAKQQPREAHADESGIHF